MSTVEIIEDANTQKIAVWLEGVIAQCLSRSDERVKIAVPGGSTPFPIFAELAKSDLDFARLDIFMTDDRVVPADHPASNVGRVAEIFEGATEAKVHPLNEDDPIPEFDLVWLGMGADGHIASLFPNTDPQADDSEIVRRLTPDPLPPEAPFDRVTLTIPALLRTSQMIFVIRGEEKRAVFDAGAAGESDLPIARLLKAAAAKSIPVTVFA
ncbi:MAG: 6-phosphogluconolactonase [Pseudomonadota bacterium]